MVKKIVFLVLFVVIYGGIAFYLTTNPENAFKDSVSGGKIEGDTYINEQLGIEIDISGGWICYNKETAPAGSEYINEDWEGENTVVSMTRPDAYVDIIRADEPFDRMVFSNMAINEYLSSYLEMLGEYGGTVKSSHAGTAYLGSQEIYYYTVDYLYDGYDITYYYGYYNTDDYGVCVILESDSETSDALILDMFENKIVIDGSETAGVTI